MRFWDSSAVVPLLVRQPATSRADEWFDTDQRCVLWTLTSVEITSALWRLVRDEELKIQEALAAEERLGEFFDASYVVTDTEAVKPIAQRLLRVHSLRAADAMQLGAALLWAGGQPREHMLHTLDARLRDAALKEGFEVPTA